MEGFHGRKEIRSGVEAITAANVADVIAQAMVIHSVNQSRIKYLWDYYKGKQPIEQRIKETRPEINNKIVVNRANEIVSFKSGYLMGEPIQYIYKGNDPKVAKAIETLNDFMFAEEKETKDKEIADWFYICGTAFRMVLPDREEDDAPFEIFTMNPMDTFVVYQNGYEHTPLLGCTFSLDQDGNRVFYAYSKDTFYKVVNGNVVTMQRHRLKGIPIVEYPLNMARIGAFELVLDLLNAINAAESDRQDAADAFVQAFMLFHNVDITSEDFTQMKAQGAIKVTDVDPQMPGEVKYIVESLSQADTQVLVNDLYTEVLTITGMPNRNGGSSTSDTGVATIFRDGWAAADARAKNDEQYFKRSEKEFLKIALQICKDTLGMDVKVKDIEIRFTRRNYENIVSKANVLVTMLGNDRIHPRLAFEHCGMFADPGLAYQISEEFYEDNQRNGGGNPENPSEGQSGGTEGGTGEDRDRGDQTQVETP